MSRKSKAFGFSRWCEERISMQASSRASVQADNTGTCQTVAHETCCRQACYGGGASVSERFAKGVIIRIAVPRYVLLPARFHRYDASSRGLGCGNQALVQVELLRSCGFRSRLHVDRIHLLERLALLRRLLASGI